jgi:hypothetical protein
MSSTESEYISLSQSLREVLPLMELARELSDAGFNLGVSTPKIHCKAFEDNSGALEMARISKLRPSTKHLNIKYHHVREAVKDGSVSIHSIRTENQQADIFTKPLPAIPFAKLHMKIMGW